MHCHVVLTPESGSMQLAVLMESGITLLTVRNPCIHRIVVSWPPSHMKAKQWNFMVSLEMLFSWCITLAYKAIGWWFLYVVTGTI